MPDSFTEVTHQSWGSRIGGSLKGILFGLLLFIAAFPLLFWNEGRAIQTQKSLEEGAAAVIPVSADVIDPQNEGKLVYASGMANTDEQLSDTLFNISTQAISLNRNVLVYQWRETSESKTEKEMGGSSKTTTTYNYSKQWSSSLIASTSFKHPEGHQNPTSKRYNNNTSYASNVMLGQFNLNSSQIRGISGKSNIELSTNNIPADVEAEIVNGEIYIGNSQAPQIGDVRISFHTINPQTISLVAAQSAHSFSPYQTSVGKSIELLYMGIVTAQDMFANELSNNRLLTWGLRFLGFIIMTIGLSMIMKPLSVLADVIPFIGNILEAGTGFVSAIIAVVFSLTTIAIAWVFYRPLVAAGLIAIVIGSIVYLKKKVKNNSTTADSREAETAATTNARRTPSSSVPPPPPPA